MKYIKPLIEKYTLAMLDRELALSHLNFGHLPDDSLDELMPKNSAETGKDSQQNATESQFNNTV